MSKRYRVAVIERDPMVRRTLSNCLRAAGCDVDGLASLRALSRHWDGDVIVLGKFVAPYRVAMASRMILDLKARHRVPVVVIAEASQTKHGLRGLAADVLVVRPFPSDELFEAVETALRGSRERLAVRR
jgi:DNA-binding response OmpR family regulator